MYRPRQTFWQPYTDSLRAAGAQGQKRLRNSSCAARHPRARLAQKLRPARLGVRPRAPLVSRRAW